MTSNWLVAAAFAGVLVFPPSVRADDQPPRWVKADDLRVRSGPGSDQSIKGLLQRGEKVILRSRDPIEGYCMVEMDALHGYVACQYLSAEPVARPHAGEGGIPGDQRWIRGTAVNLRTGPSRMAEVVSRLAVNRTVKLLRADADAGYCQVQPLDRAGKPEGASGYTACQYLGLEPLPAVEAAGIGGDLVSAFWRSPGWEQLASYAQLLAGKLPDAAKKGPWPRDPELERMKAHLALGLKAPAPGPLPDWASLKALAAENDPALLSGSVRAKADSGKDKDLWRQSERADSAARRIQSDLWLYGPLYENEGGGERVLRLMRALEMPVVQASLFRNETQVGPPGESIPPLAGRFGRVFRTLVAPRKPNLQDGPPNAYAGLYDMFSSTVALSTPVQRVQLYRDGSLKSEANFGSVTVRLWGDADIDEEPQCEDWKPGFGFGDADGRIWNYFGDDAARMKAMSTPRTAGPPRLFSYNAVLAPPRSKAIRSENVVKLDYEATGFARFTQMGFDIDGDGVPDLMVLEGVGKGPGHLGGVTTTDDPWYRLLVANIGGAWKVLGNDTFSYGCGC